MLTRSSRTFTLWLFLGDMLLTLVALIIARQIRLALPLGMTLDPLTGSPLAFNIDWTFYALVLVVWVAVFVTLPVYDGRRSLHAIGDVQITLVAIGFAILILAGLAYFFYRDLSRVLFVYFALVDATLLTAWRAGLRLTLRVRHAAWPGSKRRVLIVGTGPLADEVAARLSAYTWTGLELAGFLSNTPDANVLGPLSAAASIVTRERIDEVLIALPLRSQQDMIDLITDLQRHTVSVRVVPDLFDLAFTRAGIDDLDGIPIVSLRDPVLTPVQRIVKRVFDLSVASVLSVVGALPMAIIALAIKRDSPGPAIFCQQRVGEQGKLFWMYKFRTMIDRADDHLPDLVQPQTNGQVVFKRPDDPRLTRVGRWLRQFSLDELPQLWNVLIGDMSLVGPRPELPWLVDQYADWQRKRFNVPQGMTGWWQVNGRSEKPTLAKTRDDLYYIQNYSLLLDILILWKTIGAVIKRTGAF
ncbi:MAG: sugar transferase [Chloroflexi bacterium]|nr:sugar transferase [Chloroflexota bacterium]